MDNVTIAWVAALAISLFAHWVAIAHVARRRFDKGYDIGFWNGTIRGRGEKVDSLYPLFVDQRAWSRATFGPESFKGPRGPLDHLGKEANEAYYEADPEKQKVEIIDCLILTLDAAWRAGMSYDQIVDTYYAKMKKNKARVWPDWRGTDPDKAIEHDRTFDGV